MEKRIISFEGFFQLWTYNPSHGQLLLRSHNRPAPPKRIDILFYDVFSIEIGTGLEGITIDETGGQEDLGPFSGLKKALQSKRKCYRITTRDWTGRILAGQIHWHADDLGYGDPSNIYKPDGLASGLEKRGYLLDYSSTKPPIQ